jgi:hypothetical protein
MRVCEEGREDCMGAVGAQGGGRVHKNVFGSFEVVRMTARGSRQSARPRFFGEHRGYLLRDDR